MFFRRKDPNIPVLAPSPRDGAPQYVWPQERRFTWGTVPAGTLFYTEGDEMPRGSSVRNPVFQFTRKRKWWWPW